MSTVNINVGIAAGETISVAAGRGHHPSAVNGNATIVGGDSMAFETLYDDIAAVLEVFPTVNAIAVILIGIYFKVSGGGGIEALAIYA